MRPNDPRVIARHESAHALVLIARGIKFKSMEVFTEAAYLREADAVGASELLAPLIDAIQRHVLAGAKLHADDTPMPVLSPGSGKTKTGRLWTYVRDERPAGEDTAPAVWFAYSEDRKGEHPRQHLKSFKGGLQADAYAGFHHLYGDGMIYEVACWAHARRKFHEIHVIHASPTTTEALARIGALYAIEEEVRGSLLI